MLEFTCPKCGSHCFGSGPEGDGSLRRNCQVGTLDGRGGCGFTWNQRDDEKYMRVVEVRYAGEPS